MIHDSREMERYLNDFTVRGLGGTDFRPAFAYVSQLLEAGAFTRLRGLIYFTDGDGIYPRQRPDYETAFVFLKRTDKMKLVPSWAKCLITREAGII